MSGMPHLERAEVWHLWSLSVAFQLLKCGISGIKVWHYGINKQRLFLISSFSLLLQRKVKTSKYLRNIKYL